MPNDRMTSLVGIFVLMFAGWIVSRDRRRINVRLIITGLLLQSAFALLIFTLPAGAYIFSWLKQCFD